MKPDAGREYRNDSVDVWAVEYGEQKFVGRVLCVDGVIVTTGAPWLRDVAGRPVGDLVKRGRLVDPSEGLLYLEAFVEQHVGTYVRAGWTPR